MSDKKDDSPDRPSLVSEFWFFLSENKKWWLLPIIVVVVLMTFLSYIGGTSAGGFIYTLF
jgi:uncharacterized protein YdaL